MDADENEATKTIGMLLSGKDRRRKTDSEIWLERWRRFEIGVENEKSSAPGCGGVNPMQRSSTSSMLICRPRTQKRCEQTTRAGVMTEADTDARRRKNV